MTFEHKENTGTFRVNDRKETDSHAYFTGDAKINGNAVWINVWKNKDKNGKEYFKFSIKPKDLSRAKEAVKSTPPINAAPVAEDFDSEIPF